MSQKTCGRPDAGFFRKLPVLVSIALSLFTGPSLSAQNQPQTRGFFANSSASYDRAFSDSASALYLTPYDIGLLTQSDYWFLHQSLIIQIPLAMKIFDVYMALGITAYPFRDILSVSANAGISVSNIILNHLAYTGNLRAGVDIPVFRNYNRHYLSLGTGLRHRSGIRLFDYMDVPEDYFRIFNTFFFEIAYRIKM
jgi:hypothetical protein